ncbi:hypothetical protein [Rhodoferax sp.]|uniref:hypothetical protein n=1 Tax=Rhodoferax sp. TaxID=50421 RepID=UPI0039B8BBB3
MNLTQPYGDGSHRRISWRRSWAVDREALTATHKETGFSMAFTPCPAGGYTARLACMLPELGPDGRTALAQIDGLRQLQVDGWEIFHTVIRKQA